MTLPSDLAVPNAIERLPKMLREHVAEQWRSLRELLPELDGGERELLDETLPYVFACSEFVARGCQRDPAWLHELLHAGLLNRAYRKGEMRERLDAALRDCAGEEELKSRLRRFRNRELLRVAWRDLCGWADLHEVTATLSDLADGAIAHALDSAFRAAEAAHGTPRAQVDGEPVPMIVLALGKLGAGELNFSSDIDLIFAYEAEGETDGARPVSNHEFFVRVGQGLIDILSARTGDGIVFRVDMRLRPNGNSGPLALSFDATENYYQTHGRDWERYALIKARVAAGDQVAGEDFLSRVKPFVFRKYLDYGAFEALREMKTMIEREVSRRGLEDNIKLGAGGIREVEFIGQALQLIRGGREPALQTREILTALSRLAKSGHLRPQAAVELTAAYVFLRNSEHRLQMLDDQQTHALPADPEGRLRLALAMGFSDFELYRKELARHRRRVHEHFSMIFTAPQGEAAATDESGLAALWLNTLDAEAARRALAKAGFSAADAVRDLLRGLREGPGYIALSADGRARMDRLMPLLLAAAGLAPKPEETLARLIRLIEAIGGRSVYFALLVENPMALSQLVKLCAASPWISNWISQHPILLDELLDPRELYSLPSDQALASELREQLEQLDENDSERFLDLMREFRHGHVLRVAAAAIAADLAPETAAGQLARLAETVLAESLRHADRSLRRQHGAPRCPKASEPEFAVIAYGKLGSRELGYASDLDLIFIYEGCEEGKTSGPRVVANEQYFARLGQRLIHYLTVRTGGGILYEVDTRLRPSGKAGTLVSSLAAFERYQREQAWTWEHQALVRARPVCGPPRLAGAFAALRHEVLCQARDARKLLAEVREMRAKMLANRGASDAELFDVKHDRGGIVDIEFMVQYWVLRWAHDHPELTRHTDNLSILDVLARVGRIGRETQEVLASAYRCYLSAEHRLKLMEQEARLPLSELGSAPEAVARIWKEIFDEE